MRRWAIGDSAGAHSIQREGLLLAERSRRPYTIAQAATFAGFLALLDEDWDEASRLGDRAFRLADEYGFPRWLGTAQVIRGRARCERAEAERGLAEIREGVDALWRSNGQFAGSILFSFHAGGCLRLGPFDEGLAITDSKPNCGASGGEYSPHARARRLARRDRGPRRRSALPEPVRWPKPRERTRSFGAPAPVKSELGRPLHLSDGLGPPRWVIAVLKERGSHAASACGKLNVVRVGVGRSA